MAARRRACASLTALGAPSSRRVPVRTRTVLVTCLAQNAPANSRLCHPANVRRTHATFTVKVCTAASNSYTQATWSNTNAGQIGQGACITANGYTGTATRQCTSDGLWGAVLVQCTAVVPPCSQVIGYQGRTNWPSTTAGTTAYGTCVTGYTISTNGPPTRLCTSSSVWNATVVNDCIVGAFRT